MITYIRKRNSNFQNVYESINNTLETKEENNISSNIPEDDLIEFNDLGNVPLNEIVVNFDESVTQEDKKDITVSDEELNDNEDVKNESISSIETPEDYFEEIN